MKCDRVLNPKGIKGDVSTPFGIVQVRTVLLGLAVLLATPLSAAGESGSPAPPVDELPDAPQPTKAGNDISLRAIPVNILRDQATIWTSPFHVQLSDLKVVVPLVFATGAAIATDHRAVRDVITHDTSLNNASTNASNVLIGGFIAAPVLLYGVGHFGSNEHARETGILGAEALLDGVVVEQGMKLIFWRERPYQDQGRGRFFQTSAGVDSSFPSSHTVLAWSAAALIAGEYDSPWAGVLAYGGAAGVSFTRLLGQQHFPSDVLVGSAAGWLIGHYIYKHRHRFESKHGYEGR